MNLLYVIIAMLFSRTAWCMQLEFPNPELAVKFPELPIQVNGSIAGHVGPVTLTVDSASVYQPVVGALATGYGLIKIANSCKSRRRKKPHKPALSRASSTANLTRSLVKSNSEMSLESMENGLQPLNEPKKSCSALRSCWSPMWRDITIGLLYVLAGYYFITVEKLPFVNK